MNTHDIFGVISEAIPAAQMNGKTGWYRAKMSDYDIIVKGVSIKGTTLEVGQKVRVVQCGHWKNPKSGHAFAETNSGIETVYEMSIEHRASVASKNPAGAALACLFHKAGNVKQVYHPGVVTGVNATTLELKDWFSEKSAGKWSVSTDLSASAFGIGDGVLCQLMPNQKRQVVGWWDTVPSGLFGLLWKWGQYYAVAVDERTASLQPLPSSAFTTDPTLGTFDVENIYKAWVIVAVNTYSNIRSMAFKTSGPSYLEGGFKSIEVFAYKSKPSAVANNIPETVYSFSELPAGHFEFLSKIYDKQMPDTTDFLIVFNRGKRTGKNRFDGSAGFFAQDNAS